MPKISELVQGDEVYCQMRLGLALTIGQRGDGSIYRYVPSKPQKAKNTDLTSFIGWVIRNDPDQQVLTMHVSRKDTHLSSFNREKLVADVSYTALSRIKLFSKVQEEANTENTTFPANFDDAKFKPYKILIDVTI